MTARPARLPALPFALVLALAATTATAQGAAPEFAIRAVRRSGLPARAAALLVSGQQGGPIGISALAVPLAVSGDHVRLAVAIDVDGASLVAGRGSGTMPVDLAAYAIGASGGVLTATSSSVMLDLEHGADTISARGIKLLLVLEAPLATTAVRALVYAPEVASFGVVEAAFAAAPATAGAAFIAPPLLADPPDVWLLASDQPPVEPAYPFAVAGEPVVPAARPVLAPAGERQAWLITRGQPGDLAGVTAAITTPDGAEVAPVAIRVGARVASTGVDVTRVVLAVPDVPAGSYVLRVAGAAAGEGARPVGALPVLVAPAAAGRAAPVWTAFLATGEGEAGTETPVAAPRGGMPLQPVGTLKAAYLTALGRFASDGRGAAAAAVAEMETEAIGGGSLRETRRLLQAEGDATRDLLAADPASLLALLALHVDLHDRYGATSRVSLQSHTSTRIEELATAVAFHGGAAGSRAIAAAALCCFAGQRHSVGDLVIAARMYNKALLVDPVDPTALAGLGAVLEAAGLFAQAVDVLERLVDKQSDNGEAKLRLAVNLRRAGADKRAAKLLESCITPANPPWVRAVAYQELVRSLIAGEEWAAARARLEQALAALPDDPGLGAQLAYDLDRSGHAAEGRAAARRVVRAGAAETARYHYARSPDTQTARECELVAAQREPAEAALVRALAAPAGATR